MTLESFAENIRTFETGQGCDTLDVIEVPARLASSSGQLSGAKILRFVARLMPSKRSHFCEGETDSGRYVGRVGSERVRILGCDFFLRALLDSGRRDRVGS